MSIFDLGGDDLDQRDMYTMDAKEMKCVAPLHRMAEDPFDLGGEDFDQRVMQYLMKTIRKPRREDGYHQWCVEIEALCDGTVTEALTHACLEDINNDLFQNPLDPAKPQLEDPSLKNNQIDDITSVDGPARIPQGAAATQ